MIKQDRGDRDRLRREVSTDAIASATRIPMMNNTGRGAPPTANTETAKIAAPNQTVVLSLVFTGELPLSSPTT
jgi:hypothetical protein